MIVKVCALRRKELNELAEKPSPSSGARETAPVHRCGRRHGNERPVANNQEFSDNAESTFEFVLSQVHYLSPQRDYSARSYYTTGIVPSDVGKNGGYTIYALLAARVGGNKVGEIPLENYIAEKLKDLGLIDSFRLEELREGTNIFRVLVRHTPESPEVSLTDVGSGVSQVLSVLVQCYYAPESSTIVLELPELHLHPSVQSGLADIFIDAYQKNQLNCAYYQC